MSTSRLYGGGAAVASVPGERLPAMAALERMAWPGLIAIIAAWAVCYVAWPFSSDQGTLSWVGDVIARGGVPYRDAWEIRGPFPFLLYAAIESVFGRTQWALRVVDLGFVALGAWSVAMLARQLGGRVGSRCAMALYVLWYAALGHHETAQSDGWNAAMIAAAVAALLPAAGQPGARRTAMAAALFALCVLSKPTYAGFLLIPFGLGIAWWRERGAAWVARFWIVGAVALAATVGACLGWYIANDAFDALIDIHYRWVVTRYTDVDAAWLNRVQVTLMFLTEGKFATALAPAVLGWLVVARRRRDAAVAYAAWLFAAVLAVMAQGNFFPYHWHPLYTPLAVVAGIGLAEVLAWWRRERTQLAGAAARSLWVVVFTAVLLAPVVHLYRWGFALIGIMSTERYEAIEFGPFGRRSGAFSLTADYLRSRLRPDETFLVWGGVPGLYYDVGRPSPTRFGYVDPLVAPQDDDFRRRYRQEFLARILAAPPVYVVALDDAICARAPSIEQRRLIGPAEVLMECLADLPELRALVDHQYVAEHRIGSIVLHRLRPGAAPPPPANGAQSGS